jgi:peroxiredoxin-like protein
MQTLPHHYTVSATGKPEGDVSLSAAKLETISSAPPAEFGGPGNRWSPESLLVAAVADCFILSFRAVASASKLPWMSLDCEVVGKLERSEGITKFTEFVVTAKLTIPQETTEEKAHLALEKAEVVCLITNSLSGKTHLNTVVTKLE